jgi:uncharacterized flavoprotein (TIGR03862 family)
MIERTPSRRPVVAVVGAGPAGLMAAETLAAAGAAVTVFDRMARPGRKFLLAGRGGLNLTHSEPFERFVARYGAAADFLRPALAAFPPAALRAWAEGLGQETFVGTSGRVFPKAMKASPLLRAWLRRLDAAGVSFVPGRRWTGWDASGALAFVDAAGPGAGTRHELAAEAAILALGGASWPHLGADGAWTAILERAGVEITPLAPANCGFTVAWSEVFRRRFAGAPLKNVAIAFAGRRARGEAVVTDKGIEGGAVYALAGALRDSIAAGGPATVAIDLRPDMAAEALARRLASVRGKPSLADRLRKAGFAPVAAGLLREPDGRAPPAEPLALAARLKSVPVRLEAPFGLARAISSAGGIALSALDQRYMLRARPGVFAAGEMLDWEAPTGGYLLQACLATGIAAARGAIAWLAAR